MTYQTPHIAFISPGLRSRIDLFFAEKGQGFNAASLASQRLGSILMMDALSDAELFAMDLTRDDILPFVFEDFFAPPTQTPRATRRA
jgi:hypothetical protein